MKQFMPNTHIPTEGAFIARAYAAGALSFDDIADDRGGRVENTFDMPTYHIPSHTMNRGDWEAKNR